MNIVRITLEGYGCEVARGVISQGEYKKAINSNSLDNIWHKNLYGKKIKKEFKKIDEQFHHIGLIKGDIKVEVDGIEMLEIPISVTNSCGITKKEKLNYPETNDIVITTIQHQEGVVCDIMFITAENFDIDKLQIIEKEIESNIDNPLIPSLYCEIRYDGEEIPITGTITDLRMSRLFYDTDEKNKNR